jgi:hypothetical protein
MKTLTGKNLQKLKKLAGPKPRGLVLYVGPSMLEPGATIAVIATLETSNVKTGDMVQVWIIRVDINPVAASKAGMDSAICGSCVHRHFNGGACYVNIGQAPNAVYKAFIAGKYPEYDAEKHEHFLRDRRIRLGAYGDPAAAPFEVMEYLANVGTGHTGYTHQTRHANFDPRFIDICMVSADSPKQAAQWHEKGARTFRVAMEGDAMFDNEIECLSDSVGAQCITCGLCDGSKRNADSIVITVHGSRASSFKTATLIPTVEVA